MKAIIIGWFGKNNLGDDLLENIARNIILNNSSIKSLISISISDLYNKKAYSEKLILEADVVFVGPGGLINRGVEYIIEPLMKAKKIFLIGLSIEDYTGSSDNVLHFLAQRASVSLFRDSDSVDYFNRFSPVGSVNLISDLYLSANAAAFPNEVRYYSDKRWIALPRIWDKSFFQNRYFVYLKNKLNNPAWLLSHMQSNSIKAMCQHSGSICVIDPSDSKVFSYLSKKYNSNFLGCISNESELREILVGKNLISSRYHGSLIALKYGVYTESYCYQNKLKSLCLSYELPIYGYNETKSNISLSKLKDDGCLSMLELKSKLSYL